MALTEGYKVDKEDTEEKELYLVWRTWWEISWEAHGRLNSSGWIFNQRNL
jgi:hypothetical protein